MKNLIHWFTLPLCLLFIFSCFLFLSGFTVVGHRGDPLEAPEETFQSFNTAFTDGASYAELDLRESKDGTLVIAHDANLKRICGANISISKTDFAQLHQFKQSNGEPVHSLAELFAYYQKQPNARFMLETKKSKKNKPTDMEAKVAALVKQYHMEKRVLVQSFSAASVESFSQLLPTVPRYLIASDLQDIDFATLQNVTGINLDVTLLTPTILQQFHSLGKKVFVWSDMDEQASALANLSLTNIDGIVTNYTQLASTYERGKQGTTLTTLTDTNATIDATHKVTSVMNPYVTTNAAPVLQAQRTYRLTDLVSSTHKTYAALDLHRWVNTDYLNFGTDALLAAPYLNGTFVLKPKRVSYPLVTSPSRPQQISDYLPANTATTITAVKLVAGRPWFELNQSGWLPAEQGLTTLAGTTAKKTYQQLPADARISAIQLPQAIATPNSQLVKHKLPLFWPRHQTISPIHLQAHFNPQND
ncbi:glycerophosphodiester phosphodiesterase [Loigolactobacillus binensis]|uniref:Glycerophosphodiester phosphodiesterase n=1 Tax=Loigolactobacillus binensis TaxID=2559922 RepID=A0ABW3EDA1_9LACO|nr:glycerophosphodiester phosphodiesterase [Loigolactobacillus binensis]